MYGELMLPSFPLRLPLHIRGKPERGVRFGLSMRLIPIFAVMRLNLHRHAHVQHRRHLLGHDLAERVGLRFDFEAISRAPNTLLSHRLIALTPDSHKEAVIDAIYAERGRRGPDGNLVYFSSSPASTQASVANRFVAERADALAMLEAAR